MRKILILTNTYFQLITAIQIRRAYLQDAHTDLVISNHSLGCQNVSERLKQTELFQEVFFVSYPESVREPNLFVKMIQLLPMAIDRERELEKIISLPDDYDEIWFNNAIVFTHMVWRHCKKASLIRFEEGFSTYTKPLTENQNVERMFRTAFGNISKAIRGIYLYHPELFDRNTNSPVYPIPLLDRDDIQLREILNNVFDYQPHPEFRDVSYIFFEESFRQDNENVGDYELIRKTVDFIGHDHIIIKRHPRNTDNPYKDSDIKTDKNKNTVPWEVIQMNEHLENKVLLSISSGSLITTALYFNQPNLCFYLFRCLSKRPKIADDSFENYVNRLQKYSEKLLVPNSFQEFCDIISA